ncbi:MAG: glycosyltransferase family 2 protein [Candidatus Omnitrophica bacterium]|nr:glycosyltransferase family 2 protein [Candidatus Omnitrophota bacterium]
MKKHRTLNTVRRTLSVVLATRNEEENIGLCLKSVEKIADEIIVMDEYSTDKTRDIAEKYGAEVYKVKHEPIFHKTKQKAIEKASGDWIFQLDADERVTPPLAQEIRKAISLSDCELKKKIIKNNKKRRLFSKHQAIIDKREGGLGKKTGEVVAFFIARKNFFLGKPIKYAGVYPDGVIRLFKKSKARLPARSVHELMEVDGEVKWLENDLEHHESPTLRRYIQRANRYTDLHAKRLARLNTPKNILYLFLFTIIKPIIVFFKLLFRHKGFLDGMRGFIWSLFSALHYPLAYWKYWQFAKS